MYGYVFDSFVQDGKFRAETQRIESRLVTLGIQGRQEKMTILKNLVETCQSMIKRGVDTLVVIGNDETVLKVLPLVVEHNIPLGLIPLGDHQRVSEALGIPMGLQACDVLSRRVMRRIDLGRAGETFFLLDALLPDGSSVTCDETYTVSTHVPGSTIRILNLLDQRPGAVPDDGSLTVVVERQKRGGLWHHEMERSFFSVKKAEVRSARHNEMVVLDGQLVHKTPLTISVDPKKLHMIVGRERQFE